MIIYFFSETGRLVLSLKIELICHARVTNEANSPNFSRTFEFESVELSETDILNYHKINASK